MTHTNALTSQLKKTAMNLTTEHYNLAISGLRGKEYDVIDKMFQQLRSKMSELIKGSKN